MTLESQNDSFNDDLDYTESKALVTQKVTNEWAGVRLDKFLADNFKDYSRNQLIRLIDSEAVSMVGTGDVVRDADYRVKLGEQFQVVPQDAVEASPKGEDIELDILYEDTDLLVVNKPAGMVVHPGAGNHDGTLVNALLFHCKGSLSGIGGVKRPGIVHRIDKDTSGILVVAKNDFAHVKLSEQFAVHSIERVYQAFVWGSFKDAVGTIVGNIGRSPTNRQKMAIVKNGGKEAVTHFERQAVFGGGVASHIACILETGRTHQIRVHMASIGHSLIGDGTYGVIPKNAPEFAKYFPRQALHAGYLSFIHPRTDQKMSFEAPLPADMAELLARLKALG